MGDKAFEARINKALNDEHLRGALLYTTQKLYNGRLNAKADLEAKAAEGLALGTVEELRARAREIKGHTLKHLDYYLMKAAEQIRKNGGQVYWAKDAHDVTEITKEICKKRNAKMVVKSKSMASEEVHLNKALEDIGINVIESDLGEYIIQLAHEGPAHIVIPAIHKTRSQIAKLFSDVAGEQLPTDTPTLTAFARKTLRRIFMTADVGISGSNFVVAETGTLCLVTNEGNGRLTTSAPPCHIAVVGIEKLVPTLEDLTPVLGLLPRHGTGQKITTYFNMITGARRPGEPDGPEELHVIFMDNGRTNALGSKYEEALMCIRCGACLNACPVYQNIGGHAYGSTYPGPIGSVISPVLHGFEKWNDLPQACSLCGACTEACPMGIHLHDHIVNLRADLNEAGYEPFMLKTGLNIWSDFWLSPSLYLFASKAGRMGMNMLAKKAADGTKYIDSLPSIASGWTSSRTFPPIAPKTFKERWAEMKKGGGAK